jgi:hypothetical protein
MVMMNHSGTPKDSWQENQNNNLVDQMIITDMRQSTLADADFRHQTSVMLDQAFPSWDLSWGSGIGIMNDQIVSHEVTMDEVMQHSQGIALCLQHDVQVEVFTSNSIMCPRERKPNIATSEFNYLIKAHGLLNRQNALNSEYLQKSGLGSSVDNSPAPRLVSFDHSSLAGFEKVEQKYHIGNRLQAIHYIQDIQDLHHQQNNTYPHSADPPIENSTADFHNSKTSELHQLPNLSYHDQELKEQSTIDTSPIGSLTKNLANTQSEHLTQVQTFQNITLLITHTAIIALRLQDLSKSLNIHHTSHAHIPTTTTTTLNKLNNGQHEHFRLVSIHNGLGDGTNDKRGGLRRTAQWGQLHTRPLAV